MTPAFRDTAKSEKNHMKISDIRSANEIVEFMMTKIPLCDYCAIQERRILNQWRPNSGDMSEWFV